MNNTIKNNIIHIKKKYSGIDERPINETCADIHTIKLYHEKMKLLKLLQSSEINDEEKVKIIYKSRLLDELNPNIIKPPNFTKGLTF
jgi:hypothetical protein